MTFHLFFTRQTIVLMLEVSPRTLRVITSRLPTFSGWTSLQLMVTASTPSSWQGCEIGVPWGANVRIGRFPFLNDANANRILVLVCFCRNHDFLNLRVGIIPPEVSQHLCHLVHSGHWLPLNCSAKLPLYLDQGATSSISKDIYSAMFCITLHTM